MCWLLTHAHTFRSVKSEQQKSLMVDLVGGFEGFEGYKSVRYVYVNVVLNYVDAVETEHIVLSYHKIL